MIEHFKGLIPPSIEVLQCEVIKTGPLVLRVVDQPKRQFGEDDIILTRNVSDYTTQADIKKLVTGENVEVKYFDGTTKRYFDIFNFKNAEVTFKNALKINEIVLVLGFNDAQKFMVIDRVV